MPRWDLRLKPSGTRARRSPSANRCLRSRSSWIQANHARIMKKRAEAVGYYDKLATLLPGSDEVLSDLAAALVEKADYDRAFVEYTKLADRDKENLDALMGLGRVEVKRDKPQAALEHLNKALTIAIKRGNLEGQATAREWIGVAYRILNKSDLALSEFEQALKIARQIGRKRMIAEIVHEIGKVNANLGKFEASLKYYKESMALREEMKDQEGIGDTLIDFGNAYGNTGRLDQALTAFTDSLQIQRDQQNAVYEGLLLSNIGAIYTIRADHQAALTYYQQGLSVSEKLKNPGYTANVLYNIGETQFRLGRYAEAQERFLQAIKLRRDANNVRGEAEVRSSLAKLFGHQGRFDAARTTAKEAYDAMQSTSEQSDWTVVISAEYGSALGHLGRVEEAAKVLEPAAVLAGKLEIWALLSDVRNYQGDLYARYGDLTRARSFYEQALQAATKVNDAARMSLSRLHLAITTAQEGRRRGRSGESGRRSRQVGVQTRGHVRVDCARRVARDVETVSAGATRARGRAREQRTHGAAHPACAEPLLALTGACRCRRRGWRAPATAGGAARARRDQTRGPERQERRHPQARRSRAHRGSEVGPDQKTKSPGLMTGLIRQPLRKAPGWPRSPISGSSARNPAPAGALSPGIGISP